MTPEPGDGSLALTWPGKSAAAAEAASPPTGAFEPPWPPGPGGHLVVGENLEVLKRLRASHAGRVKAIYIDPPYNTGVLGSYRDRFARSGDPRGHAAWLSVMYPRLLLARELLREDGVILVSIDEVEVARLRLLLDEVFGEARHQGTFTWETKRAPRGVPPRNLLIPNHEYILCYAKGAGHRFRGEDRDPDAFSNPDGDPRGPWRSESLKATGRARNLFDLVDPATGHRYPGNWAFTRERLEAMAREGLLVFPPDGRGVPRQKKFPGTYRNPTKAIVTSLGWYSTERATAELIRMFDGEKVFDFPKPLDLMRFLLRQALPPGELVLDFFAGSGTTGHAVMALNAEDGGDRGYLLVQDASPLSGRWSTIDALAEERLRRAAVSLDAPVPTVWRRGG